jgi:hypothetical protein
VKFRRARDAPWGLATEFPFDAKVISSPCTAGFGIASKGGGELPASVDPMSDGESVDLTTQIGRYNDAWNRHDVDAIVALHTDESHERR